MLKYTIESDNKTIEGSLKTGEIKLIELENSKCDIKLNPEKNYDIGAGKGNPINTTIKVGDVGIVLDGRGRPIQFKTNEDIIEWSRATKEFN